MGIDLSGAMIDAADREARGQSARCMTFARMDAEALALPPATFDVALCALGLMYMPDPEQALREMRRVLRPGGRMVSAVWGERRRCAWSAVFPIVEAEVTSDVCPLFFRLGPSGALAAACADAGFVDIVEHRLEVTLDYPSAEEACEAAFAGGPVALAGSRFDDGTRARAHARYVEAIGAWQHGTGFRLPGEFVVVSAIAPPARL
jgi:SAM-dependent methyltransferase